MRSIKELGGGLTEIGDLDLHGPLGDDVINLININGILIGEVVEDVVCSLCLSPSLCMAKDEIDPFVE